MNSINWIQVIVDIFQAVISGVFVGVTLYLLDERRALRELRLSNFRVASNWATTEPKVSLRAFDLTKANLSGHKFVKAKLEEAIFTGSKLWATNFSESALLYTNFRRAKIVGGKFTKAILNFADFTNATIKSNQFHHYEFVADFTDAVLLNVIFKNIYLEDTLMTNADLRGANFSGAVIINCDFSGADIRESKWKRVKRVENCIWKDVKVDCKEDFPKLLWEEIQKQNKSGSTVW